MNSYPRFNNAESRKLEREFNKVFSSSVKQDAFFYDNGVKKVKKGLKSNREYWEAIERGIEENKKKLRKIPS